MKGSNQVQLQLDTLTAKLTNGEIEIIEILQVPPEILTSIPYTPERLEKRFFYKLTVRNLRVEPFKEELLEAVKSISVQPGSDMGDIRWGVIFYGKNGSRITAIHCNATGRRGVIGDITVSLKGNFFKWLNNNFTICFR